MGKESILARHFCEVSSIVRMACFVLTSSQLCMLSRAGRGLLVLADWTSQCCELEWHSVMDDLPHADLAKTLARCCRIFLTVNIHTALGQDRLILIKSSTESQHSRRSFFFTAMFRAVRVHLWFVSPYVPCACPHRKLCEWDMSEWDLLFQMDTNPSWMCHFFINLIRPLCPMQMCTNIHCQSSCCDLTEINKKDMKRDRPLSNAILTSSTESLNPDTL